MLNKASPGYRGSSVTVEVPELERALLSYHARPLRPEGEAIGARFFDEDIHEEPAMQATRRRKKNPVNLV